MLFNIIKFLVLAAISLIELFYIKDYFLNYLAVVVLAGAFIMLSLSMMVPPPNK